MSTTNTESVPVQKPNPNVRSFTKEEVDAIMETDPESVETGGWRWGTTETYVVEKDGANWMFTVHYHSEDGRQRESVRAIKVRQIEVKSLMWVRSP